MSSKACRIDCLLCGTQTDCVQLNEDLKADTTSKDKDKWPKLFCKLLCIEDETLEQKLFDSYYCAQCSCKIKSVNKINTLIVSMTAKLVEIRGTVEDGLYLSNPHLYNYDEKTQSGERNQNGLRVQMISALEKVKHSASESESYSKSDACVLTDPVVLLENNGSRNYGVKKATGTDADSKEDKPENEPYYILLPVTPEVDNQNQNVNTNIANTKLTLKTDKASQCTLLNNDEQPSIDIDVGIETPISVFKRSLNGISASKAKTSAKSNSAKTKSSFSRSGIRSSLQCRVCGAKCENMDARRYHVETVHKAGSLYLCPHCKKTFKTEKTLFNHQKLHPEYKLKSENEEGIAEPEYESAVVDADANANANPRDNNNELVEDKVEETGRNASKKDSRVSVLELSVPSPLPVDDGNESVNEGNSENIEVELVQMNPEDYGDFVTDHTTDRNSNDDGIPKSIPPPDRKFNKRKSIQIPRAVEATVEDDKRPKRSTNSNCI